MIKTLYSKYNRTRDERFQIVTRILEEAEGRTVEKAALTPEGIPHIRSFADKYQALQAQSSLLQYDPPRLSEDGHAAYFPYLEGKTLTEEIFAAASDVPASERQEKAITALREHLHLIFAVKPESLQTFQITPKFLQVFGASGEVEEADLAEELGGESYAVSNIDALLDNVLMTRDGAFALDYEWVFFFPVPSAYVRYRTLIYAWKSLKALLPALTEETFLQQFPEQLQADSRRIDLYQRMERGFQEYVHGENQRIYQESYMVNTKTLRQLAEADHALEKEKEHTERLEGELDARDAELKKLREVKRLTDNHVNNLTVMIGDLRHENGELAKTLAYLNRHEALIFKVRRRLGRLFNAQFPKGTARRKRLGYIRRGLLHPAEGVRLLTTEEGKNLVRGDFEIGEEYRTYGKLVMPAEENPCVSIIIPCYNQVHYTYLCLQSILEFTKDVTYEVIIADDVSSDATAHLGDFVENLVISRNETNQGFLRNCNRAAKLARGKYVMFLNNDTKVTEGWLSSLVELIESDESIGMVGSKLVYPDGRLQEAGGIIWSDGSGWNYGRLDDPEKPEYNYVKDVDYISGAAILLSRALWEEIGGFDDRFAPAYCEDSDLAFEVRRHGRRVVYQPKSRVIHYEGVSNGTDVNGTGLKRYQVENSVKLREKWAEEFARQCENTGNPDPFRARERSTGKPMLLVIDHYVPTFDKDAGSKTTYQYLQMFVKKGYQVKFLGDNFLHEEPYTSALEQMGIEVLYGDSYVSGIWDWLEKHGGEFTAAYLNRPHIAAKYVDFLREHTKMKLIFYGHDLHFLRLGREYALTGDPKLRRESLYWKSVEFGLMRKVDISYYPSQVEIDAIHEEDENIRAKAITAYVYDDEPDTGDADFAKREDILFVGGFAHPPNADAVLWFMKEIWPAVHREIPEARFHIVGSKATEEILALHRPEEGVIVEGFVTEDRLAALYRTCRLDVVPLRYGAGVKGKVVEGLYYGSPIVTTSVGSEGIPQVEKVLRVEDDAAAFAGAVTALYRDTAALGAMSAAARDYVRDNFSTEAVWRVVRDDFAG